jgi:hypothetical protein
MIVRCHSQRFFPLLHPSRSGSLSLLAHRLPSIAKIASNRTALATVNPGIGKNPAYLYLYETVQNLLLVPGWCLTKAFLPTMTGCLD